MKTLEELKDQFEKGSPNKRFEIIESVYPKFQLTPEGWEYVKNLRKRLMFEKVEILKSTIENCFNSVTYWHIAIHTSMDRFKVFCDNNGFVFQENYENDSVILKNKLHRSN